jgi:hypothetical protein
MDDLLGKFNSSLMNKLIYILDEISNYGAAHKSNDLLKSIISGRNMRIEPKGKEAFYVNNPARLIFLSNNDWIVKVENSDRRYFICDVSDKHANDRKYFNKLISSMDEEGLDTFFKYLSEFDIKNWDYTNIPNNEARSELKLMSIPSPIRFVINRLEHKQEFINFADYVKWCGKNNEKYEDYTKRTFTTFLKNKLGIRSKGVKIRGKYFKKIDITNGLERVRIYLKNPNFNISDCESSDESDTGAIESDDNVVIDSI